MYKKRSERKAVLMAKAEALVDEMLAWDEETEAPNLGQIETEILRLRQEFGQVLLNDVANHQDAVQPVPGPKCARCGKEMHYKDQKGKTVVSLGGETKIERGYYHCPSCQGGIFPPG